MYHDSQDPTHCIQTTATSSRTAGGRMVEKRTTATKDGILGGQVPSARWPAMARVTAARCPDHAPSYKPVSCWQAHAFPGLKLGFWQKKKGSNQKDSGIRSPLDNAKIKKLNAWIASLTMSTLKKNKNTGHQLIMPQQSVIPKQLSENS